MRAGVISRCDLDRALETASKVIELLRARGVEVSVETDTALALGLDGGNTNLADLDGDFVVAIGGDGTILRVAMEMRRAETPIFGVNMGRRGFLSEVDPLEVEKALGWLMEGNYYLEEAMKVQSRVKGGDTLPDALNEVLISTSLPSKMLLLRISIDGQAFTEIQADGVLISSPTGSTAYNLSAGGSIVAPGVDALCVTAICPYSYFKSMVVPSSATIRVELLKPKTEAMAIVDGRNFTPLNPGAILEATGSPHKTRFIRFRPFYARLNRRMMYLHKG